MSRSAMRPTSASSFSLRPSSRADRLNGRRELVLWMRAREAALGSEQSRLPDRAPSRRTFPNTAADFRVLPEREIAELDFS
jgi:hypothetical protein